jgi:hypothetical protein
MEKNLPVRSASKAFKEFKSMVLKNASIWVEDAWKSGPKRQYIRGTTLEGQDYKFFIGMTQN